MIRSFASAGALVTALLVASAPGRASAVGSTDPSPPGFHLQVSVTRLGGDTSTELNARADDPTNPGTLTDIRSELEFPLDLTRLGATLTWAPAGERGKWSFAAGFRMNVDDPGDVMTDRDWIGPKEFSYTESEPEADLIGGTLEARRRIRGGADRSLSLLFVVDVEHVEQRLVGFEGWQASLFSDQRFDVSGTAPVIDYDITWLTPQVGLAFASGGAGRAWLRARATAALAYARDRDDHIRRGREAKGSGWGTGTDARVEIGILPGFVAAGPLSLTLVGELRYLFADGSTTQRWYENGDLPAGTEIPDLSYRLERVGYGAGLSLGWGR